jgi:hypothetical protein
MNPRSRGAVRPSFANSFAPKDRGRRRPSREGAGDPKRDAVRSQEGRREDRVRAAPADPCAKVAKKSTRAYRFSGSSPAFPAQWFYGLFRALLGETWLACHRHQRDASTIANLTPAIGASGPHDFAVRVSAVVNSAFASTASPRAFRDVRNAPRRVGWIRSEVRLVPK